MHQAQLASPASLAPAGASLAAFAAQLAPRGLPAAAWDRLYLRFEQAGRKSDTDGVAVMAVWRPASLAGGHVDHVAFMGPTEASALCADCAAEGLQVIDNRCP